VGVVVPSLLRCRSGEDACTEGVYPTLWLSVSAVARRPYTDGIDDPRSSLGADPFLNMDSERPARLAGAADPDDPEASSVAAGHLLERGPGPIVAEAEADVIAVAATGERRPKRRRADPPEDTEEDCAVAAAGDVVIAPLARGSSVGYRTALEAVPRRAATPLGCGEVRCCCCEPMWPRLNDCARSGLSAAEPRRPRLWPGDAAVHDGARVGDRVGVCGSRSLTIAAPPLPLLLLSTLISIARRACSGRSF
jgi:hypothetical protein